MDSKIDLKTILDLHAKWIRNEVGGVRANLSEANLSGADLSRANLYGANLSGANAICETGFTLDDLSPEEDAELDAWTEAHCAELIAPGIAEREITANWKARAEVVRQRREAMEAEQIDHSHPEIFGPILDVMRGNHA